MSWIFFPWRLLSHHQPLTFCSYCIIRNVFPVSPKFHWQCHENLFLKHPFPIPNFCPYSVTENWSEWNFFSTFHLVVTFTSLNLSVILSVTIYVYIKVYFILLHFTLCASKILHFFLQTECLWQPCIEQVYCHNFSNSICSLRVSVSHFGNSCNISNFFIIIIFVMVICDQWSLMLLLQKD